MNVTEFLDATKISLNRLSQLSGVNYGTLHEHVKKGGPIGLRVAKKLERVVVEGSDARMSAIEILGLNAPSAA